MWCISNLIPVTWACLESSQAVRDLRQYLDGRATSHIGLLIHSTCKVTIGERILASSSCLKAIARHWMVGFVTVTMTGSVSFSVNKC